LVICQHGFRCDHCDLQSLAVIINSVLPFTTIDKHTQLPNSAGTAPFSWLLDPVFQQHIYLTQLSSAAFPCDVPAAAAAAVYCPHH
jgi:hypothetical protein